MNVVVVGAGAMGSLYGGSLQKVFPEWNILLIDVWKEHVATIQSNGLTIERNGAKETVKVQACLPGEAVAKTPKPADLIIVFTKTMYTEGALEPIRPIVGPATVMMTLQNGLGNIEKLERLVPVERIIAGVTTNPCDLVGPGHIRMAGQGDTKIMTASGKITPMLEEIAAALTKAGLAGHVVPDALGIIWEKAAFNAAMNGLTSILRLTVGGVCSSKEGLELARAVVAEAAAVATKKGISFDEGRVWATAQMAFAEHQKHMPSMLQDRLAKRKTEVDSIHGGIVKGGEETGVPTPVTKVLYLQIRAIEEAYDWAELPH